jgi:outer membrane protein OmpA-like peptidoglycan-associated protein
MGELQKAGVDAKRMFIVGYGPNKPVVTPEKTKADKAKNRRVEILMVPERPKLSEAMLKTAK